MPGVGLRKLGLTRYLEALGQLARIERREPTVPGGQVKLGAWELGLSRPIRRSLQERGRRAERKRMLGAAPVVQVGVAGYPLYGALRGESSTPFSVWHLQSWWLSLETVAGVEVKLLGTLCTLKRLRMSTLPVWYPLEGPPSTGKTGCSADPTCLFSCPPLQALPH